MVVVFNFGNGSNVDDQWLRITNQKSFDIDVMVTANNTDTLMVPCNQAVTTTMSGISQVWRKEQRLCYLTPPTNL